MTESVVLIILSYILGSISFSILISAVFGISDIRKHGSGNAGATNVLRTVGKKAALLTFLCDVLKGILPVVAAYFLKVPFQAMLLSAFAAIAGHIFPVFFGFKGGKGVSTSFGAVIAISVITGTKWMLLTLICVWLVTVIITRYVSLGSVLVYGIYPVLIIAFFKSDFFRDYISFCAFAVATAVLGIYMHRKNIVRLINKTESKIGQKAK